MGRGQHVKCQERVNAVHHCFAESKEPDSSDSFSHFNLKGLIQEIFHSAVERYQKMGAAQYLRDF